MIHSFSSVSMLPSEGSLFIVTDVHLDIVEAPQRTAFFLKFLDLVFNEGEGLIILGDLFAFWANNRQLFRQYRPVFDRLRALVHEGVKVFFLPGNRDFLLPEKFLGELGIETPGSDCFLELPAGRFYLAHGDGLCSADVSYKRYKKTWWPWIRILDRLVPGAIENRAARMFMTRSKKMIENQPWRDLKLSDAALKRIFDQGVNFIVCGHTHFPEDRMVGENQRLIVLPPWTDKGGGYLRVDQKMVETRIIR